MKFKIEVIADGEIIDISDNLYYFEENGIRNINDLETHYGEKVTIVVTAQYDDPVLQDALTDKRNMVTQIYITSLD